ncbi:MAG: MMPL family transporter, partial [Enterobacteriaceae bacterium]|nr:MMPL family transporter [Enterobacteriaceae bacterium]
IGISIDANILIFERIKEEIKHGNNKTISIEKGFDHAFTSIIDSNCTTLIIGIILFIFGTGPLKGFSITLSIGIITSMYSAIFVTKTIIKIIQKKIKLI